MKKLLAIIVLGLMWNNVSFADSISKYEVAGAKLKKSILKIMNLEQVIENLVSKDPRNEKYITVSYVPDTSKYQNLEFEKYYLTINSDDEAFPIVAISIIMNIDFNSCIKKQDQ